jgi:hypothetical protein
MIEEFEAWFREHEPQFEDSSVQVKVTMGGDVPSRNIAAVLECGLYIASINLWEIGALDIHVLSISKGESIYDQRYDLENVTEMITILEDIYCKFLHHTFDSI